MRRALLALALLVGLSAPARADGVLVLCADSLGADRASATMRNIAPTIDALKRNLKPGMRVDIVSQGGPKVAADAAAMAYTLSELTDSVTPTGAAGRYDYSLIMVVDASFNGYISNPALRPLVQITKGANRPKVPVFYASCEGNLDVGSGEDSLGVNALINLTSSSAFSTSPAGYAFPTACYFYKRNSAATVSPYVTPVLWLAFYNYTKADPDGVGGSASQGAASDSMSAWFWNPPTQSARQGIANTTGYGVMVYEPAVNNGAASNFASGAQGMVAVGMMKRLAPSIFRSDAGIHVALDVDDGGKRFSGVASTAQVSDYLAGLDSLNTAKIKYTVGMEIDSLDVADANGSSRWTNEWTVIGRSGYGHVTPHVHCGATNNAAGSGGSAVDSSLATASGKTYADIWGNNSASARFCFGNTTNTNSRDRSVYAQAKAALTELVDRAGRQNVARYVMPPFDNYRTRFSSMDYDSVFYAIALAGYRVVRTQYAANQYNAAIGGSTGGINYGIAWPLPSARTIGLTLGLTDASMGAWPRSLILAPSGYIVGNTADTTTAQTYGTLRGGMNARLGKASGFAGHINATTDDVSGSRATVKEAIWVTHCPNWKQASGASSALVYGGGRFGWENVRVVHAAMMAAKWAAMQANTSTTTYFREGPIEWVWSDQITERDIR